MVRFSTALAASAALIALVAAPIRAQDAPRVFERQGSWSLDAGEDYCRLARSFTDGENTLALAMERNQLGNSYQLVLVGDDLRTFRNATTLGYRYLPGGEERQAMFITSQTPEGQTYLNLGTIQMGEPEGFNVADAQRGRVPEGPPPGFTTGRVEGRYVPEPYDRAAEISFASSVDGFAFERGLLSAIRLETGPLGGAMQALQACTDDLVRSWGLDWEAHQSLSARAEPAEAQPDWIRRNLLIREDFDKLRGSRNLFRVMINNEGSPTACTVHSPSLSDSQNEAICEDILENGRFLPALDAEGQPIASYWISGFYFLVSWPSFRR